MAEAARVFSKGELAGAVVAALAVGFFLGSMFMEMRRPAAMPGPAAMQQGTPAVMPQGGGKAVAPELQAHITELEVALAQKPGDQAGWVDLGNLYFDADLPQRALIAYGKAVALGPVGPDVLTDMGIMHREAGQPKEALAAFDAALKLDANHQNALFNKGVVLLHDLKDRAGAAAAWNALVRLNPQAKTPEGRPVKDLASELSRN